MSTSRIVIEFQPGTAIVLPPDQVAELRRGLATVEEVQQLAARIQRVEADTNIQVSIGEDNVLRISARGGENSYVATTAGRALTPDDNGRVVLVQADGVATFTVGDNLPIGFACLLRCITGGVRVEPASGANIVFVPLPQPVEVSDAFDEISVEVFPHQNGRRALVRAIAQ